MQKSAVGAWKAELRAGSFSESSPTRLSFRGVPSNHSNGCVDLHIPGRFTGEADLLVWVNATLGEHLESLQDLSDGVVFCRLLDRLFDGSFPLGKLMHSSTVDTMMHNYREMQGFLISQKIHYQIDVTRLCSGDPVALFKLCQWVKSEFDKGLERFHVPKPGKWVYDPTRKYDSEARKSHIRTETNKTNNKPGARSMPTSPLASQPFPAHFSGHDAMSSDGSEASASSELAGYLPGRFTGEGDLLGWVNCTLSEQLVHVRDLADGTVFCRLLDRLFHASFPLKRLACGNGAHNYREMQAFLLSRNIRYKIDLPRVLAEDTVALFKLCQWVKQEFDRGAEAKAMNKAGRWAYDMWRPYHSAKRRRLIKGDVARETDDDDPCTPKDASRASTWSSPASPLMASPSSPLPPGSLSPQDSDDTAAGTEDRAGAEGARRFESEEELLGWVNSTLSERYRTLSDLADGSVFCRLLDRLFHSTFPLRKLVCGAKGQELASNYRELKRFLVSQKMKHEGDSDRLMSGDPHEMFKLCGWLRFEYEQGAARHRTPRPGKWSYDPHLVYDSSRRKAMMRHYNTAAGAASNSSNTSSNLKQSSPLPQRPGVRQIVSPRHAARSRGVPFQSAAVVRSSSMPDGQDRPLLTRSQSWSPRWCEGRILLNASAEAGVSSASVKALTPRRSSPRTTTTTTTSPRRHPPCSSHPLPSASTAPPILRSVSSPQVVHRGVTSPRLYRTLSSPHGLSPPPSSPGRYQFLLCSDVEFRQELDADMLDDESAEWNGWPLNRLEEEEPSGNADTEQAAKCTVVNAESYADTGANQTRSLSSSPPLPAIPSLDLTALQTEGARTAKGEAGEQRVADDSFGSGSTPCLSDEVTPDVSPQQRMARISNLISQYRAGTAPDVASSARENELACDLDEKFSMLASPSSHHPTLDIPTPDTGDSADADSRRVSFDCDGSEGRVGPKRSGLPALPLHQIPGCGTENSNKSRVAGAVVGESPLGRTRSYHWDSDDVQGSIRGLQEVEEDTDKLMSQMLGLLSPGRECYTTRSMDTPRIASMLDTPRTSALDTPREWARECSTARSMETPRMPDMLQTPRTPDTPREHWFAPPRAGWNATDDSSIGSSPISTPTSPADRALFGVAQSLHRSVVVSGRAVRHAARNAARSDVPGWTRRSGHDVRRDILSPERSSRPFARRLERKSRQLRLRRCVLEPSASNASDFFSRVPLQSNDALGPGDRSRFLSGVNFQPQPQRGILSPDLGQVVDANGVVWRWRPDTGDEQAAVAPAAQTNRQISDAENRAPEAEDSAHHVLLPHGLQQCAQSCAVTAEEAQPLVSKCCKWLQSEGRASTEGIVQRRGLAVDVAGVVSSLFAEARGGPCVDFDQIKPSLPNDSSGDEAERVHVVTAALRQLICGIDPPLLSSRTLETLLNAQLGPVSPSDRIQCFRSCLHNHLSADGMHIMSDVVELIRCIVVAPAPSVRLPVLCKVLGVLPLRHRDWNATAMMIASGRLPAVAMTMVVSDAVLQTSFDPPPPHTFRKEKDDGVLVEAQNRGGQRLCVQYSYL